MIEKKIVKRYAIAKIKYINIAPNKLNKIAKQLIGKYYKDIFFIFKELNSNTGNIIWKALYSCVSNAINHLHYNRNNLFIENIIINKGPIFKRMQPRAKGKSFPILKRFSHITIYIKKK